MYLSFCKGGLTKTVTRKEQPISIDMNGILHEYPILIEVPTVPHSVSTKAPLHDTIVINNKRSPPNIGGLLTIIYLLC